MRKGSKCRFLIFFCSLSFILGCNSKTSIVSRKASDTLNSVDTIITDIPLHFNTNDFRKIMVKEQALLNIESINKGYKDLQIRLWIGHGYESTDSLRLVVIKKKSKKITGEFYTYPLEVANSWDSTTPINKRIDGLTPKSGWKIFIDSIGKLGIYDLPDYEKIPGYNLATDSYGVTVEIATKNIYRIYQYPNWDQYKDKFETAMKMTKILNFVEEEFKFNLY